MAMGWVDPRVGLGRPVRFHALRQLRFLAECLPNPNLALKKVIFFGSVLTKGALLNSPVNCTGEPVDEALVLHWLTPFNNTLVNRQNSVYYFSECITSKGFIIRNVPNSYSKIHTDCNVLNYLSIFNDGQLPRHPYIYTAQNTTK